LYILIKITTPTKPNQTRKPASQCHKNKKTKQKNNFNQLTNCHPPPAPFSLSQKRGNIEYIYIYTPYLFSMDNQEKEKEKGTPSQAKPTNK